MTVVYHRSPDELSASQQAAALVLKGLATGLTTKPKVSLVVSGGSSPIVLFEQLSTTPFAWEKVVITLADERLLPNNHPDRNETLVKKHLLKHNAAAASFVPLINNEASARDSVVAARQRLAGMPYPIDCAVLGMGDDGHTLSWFDDSPEYADMIDSASRHSCALITPKTASYTRLSLTRSFLQSCAMPILYLNSQSKALRFGERLADPASRAPVTLLCELDAPLVVVIVDPVQYDSPIVGQCKD